MLEIFTHKSIYSDKLRLTLGSITLCSSLHWSLSTPRSAHRDVAKQSDLVPAPRAPIYNIMATPAPSRTVARRPPTACKINDIDLAGAPPAR